MKSLKLDALILMFLPLAAGCGGDGLIPDVPLSTSAEAYFPMIEGKTYIYRIKTSDHAGGRAFWHSENNETDYYEAYRTIGTSFQGRPALYFREHGYDDGGFVASDADGIKILGRQVNQRRGTIMNEYDGVVLLPNPVPAAGSTWTADLEGMLKPRFRDVINAHLKFTIVGYGSVTADGVFYQNAVQVRITPNVSVDWCHFASFDLPECDWFSITAGTVDVWLAARVGIVKVHAVSSWVMNAINMSMDSTIELAAPVSAPSSGARVVSVSAGWYHACAALSNGKVKCWGENYFGGLGNGGTEDSSFPVEVSGITDAVAVSAGDYHTCALLSDGGVKCWGHNGYGQLGDGTTTDSPVPVDTSGITDAVAVSCGSGYACALLLNGGVKCWGLNNGGRLGDGTTTNSSNPVDVSGITNAVAVSCGNGHTCAVMSGGGVKCWGINRYGELGDGTTVDSPVPVDTSGITDAVAVSCGGAHTCAVLSNGGAKCWGLNYHGQLGDGTDEESSVPVDVLFISDATAIGAGVYNTCAALSDGRMKCWGNSEYGALGTDTYLYSDQTTPVTVAGDSDAVSVTSGYRYSCALYSGGGVKCWGYNDEGQLGNGMNAIFSTPISVIGL